MMLTTETPAITVIELWPHESECAVCGCVLIGGNLGIAMYEGCVVNDDWKGDWGGFDCCPRCFELHRLGLLPTWPNEPQTNNTKETHEDEMAVDKTS
jgi:hypothetical protein